MSEAVLALAAACALATVDTRLALDEGRWVDTTAYTVAADGVPCTHVDLTLPVGARLTDKALKLVLPRGGARRAGDDHWHRAPAALDGAATWRVLLPELGAGGRATITATVDRAANSPYRWRPGTSGARFASLRVRDAHDVSRFGAWSHRGAQTWALAPSPDDEVRAHAGPADLPAIPLALPQHYPTPPRQSALEALADLGTLVLLPRGVDGDAPLVAVPAQRRGATDDRGFARTLVMATDGGPDRVLLGAWLPAAHTDGQSDTEEGEVAVWIGPSGAQPLLHPSQPPRGGRIWTAEGIFEVPAPSPTLASDPFAAATRDKPRVARQTARLLDLPEGKDPLMALYPGGGSRMAVREVVAFPVDGRARPWVLDLPPGVVEVGVRTDPPNVPEPLWTMRLRDGDAAVVVGPNSYPFALIFEWTRDDAPTCGVTPEQLGRRPELVDASRGEIAQDGERAWRLASFDGAPLLTDRARLLRGLERRFAGLSMPEPALPTRMKFQPASWELAAQLRPTLWERTRVGALAQPAGWPRRLHRARASGAATPLEAALILRLYALQAGFDATWAMVRPAWATGTPPLCPDAYPEALLRLGHAGETQWIDPGCAVCAPWEIRPHLEGAAALGPDVERTPPPTRGLHAVEVDAETVRWRLEGPAALRFREWVSAIPRSFRGERIATRVAGPAATLVEVVGLDEAGAPITLTVARPPGPFVGEDPITLPSERPSGLTWLDWIGERRLVVADPTAAEAKESVLDVEGARWLRIADADGFTETLAVEHRLLDPSAARAIRGARKVAAGD